MNYILGLLILIAFIQLYRLYSLLSGLSVKKHFKNKLKGTRQMRWDLQFKVFKTQEIREDIRKEYDFMTSRIVALDEAIGKEKNKDEKARLKDAKELAERDSERLGAQLNNLDIEMNGTKATNEYPQGHIGLNEQIESIEELEGMIADYIKGL